MITDKNLLKEKVEKGFFPCFNSGCPRHEHCLRWQGSEFVIQQQLVVQCINPALSGGECPMYRHDEKVRMAFGFKGLLGRLPQDVGKALMGSVVRTSNRTYAYEQRSGSRPIPPDLQQHIEAFCRRKGWQGAVEFDAYDDQYEW